MKLKIIGLTISMLFLFSLMGNSQINAFTVNGITTFQNDSISNSGDTLALLKCKIAIGDTNTISKIHLKLGTTIHGNNIIDTLIIFDNIQSLPNGFIYTRTGNNIFITLGYFFPAVYYLDIKLEDVFGGISTTKTALL